MTTKNKKKWIPKIKIWDGTNVHGSYDTMIGSQLVSQLKNFGFNAEHKAQWSLEDLHNGKKAFVTHPRRLASINPYTVSQRDAEKFMIQMFKGALPRDICMLVAAHGHTTRGSLDDESFRVINLPAWTAFIEYQQALANFAHFQPDIGAYFIIVTKDGRIHTQPWLYKPFVYNHFEKKIYEAEEPTKKYVSTGKVEIEDYFMTMVKNAVFIVAAIADLHIGELAAVAPPKFSLGSEIEDSKSLTEANKRLYEYWKHFVKTCKIIKPHEIWVVGDVCGGTNVFEKHRMVLTSNLDEQMAMFIELCKLFLEKN